MVKITIFGLGGSGKSSIAKNLAKKLDYEYKSVGNFMRELAIKENLSIYEFDKKVKESNKEIDIDVDNLTKEYGKNNDDFIFEGWLAWSFIPDSFKIKLICKDDIRYKRISKRENISFEEAKQKTQDRVKLLEKRYNSHYPEIKYLPKDEVFDLIIDTTNTTVEEACNKIREFI